MLVASVTLRRIDGDWWNEAIELWLCGRNFGNLFELGHAKRIRLELHTDEAPERIAVRRYDRHFWSIEDEWDTERVWDKSAVHSVCMDHRLSRVLKGRVRKNRIYYAGVTIYE